MKDFWYNICLFCDRDTLKNIYMLNTTCNQLLNEPYLLNQLEMKFNHLDTNFKNFYNHCGEFLKPSLIQKIGKTWVKLKEKYENGTYITQFNGCENYVIIIENNLATIYDNDTCTSESCSCSDENDENDEYIKIDKMSNLVYNIERFFVGKSYKSESTVHFNTCNKHYDGNSILLHIKDNEYVFINNTAYKFNSYGRILNFSAPVGNNDVPYPYGVDEYNNVYLFGEKVMIPMTLDLMIKMKNVDDPHNYYYTHTIPSIKI